MVIVELPQMVKIMIHRAGHTLNMFWSSGGEWSWSDHFLVKFVIVTAIHACKSEGPVQIVRSEADGL